MRYLLEYWTGLDTLDTLVHSTPLTKETTLEQVIDFAKKENEHSGLIVVIYSKPIESLVYETEVGLK